MWYSWVSIIIINPDISKSINFLITGSKICHKRKIFWIWLDIQSKLVFTVCSLRCQAYHFPNLICSQLGNVWCLGWQNLAGNVAVLGQSRFPIPRPNKGSNLQSMTEWLKSYMQIQSESEPSGACQFWVKKKHEFPSVFQSLPGAVI